MTATHGLLNTEKKEVVVLVFKNGLVIMEYHGNEIQVIVQLGIL